MDKIGCSEIAGNIVFGGNSTGDTVMTRFMGWRMALMAVGLGLFALAGLAMGDTIQVRVIDGNDDAEEQLSDNTIDLTSSDLELPDEGGAVI
jgi:hypothetical protein